MRSVAVFFPIFFFLNHLQQVKILQLAKSLYPFPIQDKNFNSLKWLLFFFLFFPFLNKCLHKFMNFTPMQAFVQ